MKLSGSQLYNFRNGWAGNIWAFGFGHYFRRIGMTDEAISSCGLRVPVRYMLGIGTHDACRECLRKNGAPIDVRTFLDDLGETSA